MSAQFPNSSHGECWLRGARQLSDLVDVNMRQITCPVAYSALFSKSAGVQHTSLSLSLSLFCATTPPRSENSMQKDKTRARKMKTKMLILVAS